MGEIDFGLDMIRRGQAWYAVQYGHELVQAQRLAYEQAETRARGINEGSAQRPIRNRPESAGGSERNVCPAGNGDAVMVFSDHVNHRCRC